MSSFQPKKKINGPKKKKKKDEEEVRKIQWAIFHIGK